MSRAGHAPKPCVAIVDDVTKRRCGKPTQTSRCPEHMSGYGAVHRDARAQLALTLPAPCGYGCGRILNVGDDWHAAHVIDGDPTAGWIASCRPCNEAAKR